MDNLFYTYAYLRKNGTPYYIGKGKGERAYHPCNRNAKCPPRERILFLKINLSEEEAFRHEIYMIAVLGRKDTGTGILRNLTNGGDGCSGWMPSEESRAKMSAAKKGKKGRPRSEETRAKISAALTGKKHSAETLAKMSAAQKGKKHSEESRAKMSAAKKGNKNAKKVR